MILVAERSGAENFWAVSSKNGLKRTKLGACLFLKNVEESFKRCTYIRVVVERIDRARPTKICFFYVENWLKWAKLGAC